MTVYHDNQPEEIIQTLIQRLRPESEILDLGCGEGRNLLPFARLGHNTEGWDKCEHEIGMLKKRADEEGLAIKTIPCDIRDLRLQYSRWDVVLTILVTHFLPPVEAAERLHFVRLKIKSGGYHALVAFTNEGNLSQVRKDRFFPSPQDLKKPYKDWDIIHEKLETRTCTKPGPKGEALSNQALVFLARKP